MRVLRLILVALLAVLLIGIALANRAPVTVGLFPGNVGSLLGGSYTLTMPLFLVIFLAMLLGMVLGLVWEWLREAGIRAVSQRRAFELAKVEREAGHLRRTFAAPKDDVLAILDAPKAAPAGRAPATSAPAGTTALAAPATGTRGTLPAGR